MRAQKSESLAAAWHRIDMAYGLVARRRAAVAQFQGGLWGRVGRILRITAPSSLEKLALRDIAAINLEIAEMRENYAQMLSSRNKP